MRTHLLTRCLLVLLTTTCAPAFAAQVAVDMAGYSPRCGVRVERKQDALEIQWPLDDAIPPRETGVLRLSLQPGKRLIERLDLAPGVNAKGGPIEGLIEKADLAAWVTVGTREAPSGRPPEMSIWNTFFDNPAQRPHQTYRCRFELRDVRVSSRGSRATVALGGLTAGPFKGEWRLTFYARSPLVHAEAVLVTQEDKRAITYDLGLMGESLDWNRMVWTDTEGRLQCVDADPDGPDRPVSVRHRAIAVEAKRGAVACFPPPHQFFFPRDLTDNLKTVWFGMKHQNGVDGFGFGVRQPPTGGGGFVPWFNAPPGTSQRLGAFFLLSDGTGEAALKSALRYTHNDRFPALPGYKTFTSHWHMATAVAAMAEQASGKQRTVPDLVRVFKEMGVNAVHLAEFHGDGHQNDPGPLRLPELETMFAECKRLSDGELLLIPGEEVNTFFGLSIPGRHPGHWMSLFPKPVYWTMKRDSGQPFAEPHPQYGTLYRVGNTQDMTELMQREHGLAWSAHPRIKASSWTPDIFRNEQFYRADYWLGGAWKAMPADLSRERLGERSLDLLDDMANWGPKKYLPGEVDVFKIDRAHELYGHMNVNYLRLDRLPRYDEGWQPILDALRNGRFFVTTGEVLIPAFTVGGKQSGETLTSADRPDLRAEVHWSFPLAFAEIISGDGQKVYRERIDLADTGEFGKRTLSLKPDLWGRKWVRLEVWDVAANGAFTQPIWLEGSKAAGAR